MAERRAGRRPPGGDFRWPVAAVTAAAALPCFLGLGRPSLWIDEAHSFEFASLPSFGLVALNAAARDAYPPLYFLLLHAWLAMGSSEVWMRLLSVLCHLASVPLIYLVGRRLVSPAGGLVAAVLLAVNPFHLAFAREVRMYSLIGLLALASMHGMLCWLQDGSRRGRLVLTTASVALLYVHFIAALLLIAQSVMLAFGGWRRAGLARAGFRWALIVTAGFLPWAPFFLKAVVSTRGYGAEAPAGTLMRNFLGTLGVGFGPSAGMVAAGAVAVALAAAAGWLALPAGPKRRTLILWALLPPVLELVAGFAGKPVFGERTLITATPAWLLLAAAAVAGASRWRAVCAALLMGGLAVLGLADLLTRSLPDAPAHREALRAVLAQARPGDAIVHSATTTYHPVHEYYLPRGGAAVPDFLIEPQGEFKGGRLGEWFRARWRAARARLDPGGALKTGRDPSRLSEEEFLRRGYRRVLYFRTDLEGARRQWRLVPSVYYDPVPERVREVPWSAHPALARAYAPAGGPRAWPGLRVETYLRR